jgi:hypothetical protein
MADYGNAVEVRELRQRVEFLETELSSMTRAMADMMKKNKFTATNAPRDFTSDTDFEDLLGLLAACSPPDTSPRSVRHVDAGSISQLAAQRDVRHAVAPLAATSKPQHAQHESLTAPRVVDNQTKTLQLIALCDKDPPLSASDVAAIQQLLAAGKSVACGLGQSK